MTTSIKPVRMNHLNMVLPDFDTSVAHFTGLYGAEFLMDIPNPESHAYLFDIGRVIFEVFTPKSWLLNARYGEHYVGVEYQADMDTVRAAIAERGIRIVRDIGLALHTHPEDTLGIAFEFWSGFFHDNDWEQLDGRKMLPATYWAHDHPLGLTGLKSYTVAVRDLTAARHFLEDFISAEQIYEAPRPNVAGHAIGLRISDDVIELVSPVGPGILQDHLDRYGNGIRSTIFGVHDLGAVQRYFAERDVMLVSGTADGSLAIPASANLGILFEFAE